MSERAGRCLSCDGPTYDQSYCDACANEAENWDGKFLCPECEERESNLYLSDEPLRDCLDHMDRDDIAEEARSKREELKALNKKYDAKLSETRAFRSRLGRTLLLTGELGNLIVSLVEGTRTTIDIVKTANRILLEVQATTRENPNEETQGSKTSH